jgi:hypothetical protein
VPSNPIFNKFVESEKVEISDLNLTIFKTWKVCQKIF